MTPLRDFRGPLPLDDEDFAAVRANVRRKAEGRRRKAEVLAVAAAVALVAITALLLPKPPAPPPTRPPAAARVAAARPAVAPPVVAPPAVAPVVIAAAKPHARPRRAARPRTPPSPDHLVVRMEIPTADPNVRIIWIAQ